MIGLNYIATILWLNRTKKKVEVERFSFMARSCSLAILKVQLWYSCLNLLSWNPCSKHCLPVFQSRTVAYFLTLQENSTLHWQQRQHLPCWPSTMLLSILSTKQTLPTYLIHKLFTVSLWTLVRHRLEVHVSSSAIAYSLHRHEEFKHMGMSPERSMLPSIMRPQV